MRRALVSMTAGFALLAGFIEPAAAARRALLVGVSDYADPKASLRGPRVDLRDMKATLLQHLEYQESEILVLEDAKATKAEVLQAFQRWLIAGSTPGDEIFFYFSGHGSQVEDLDGDEEDGLDETLVAYDLKHLLDDELGALLDRLTGRLVTVVVDACHSGTGARSLSPETAADSMTLARYLPPSGVGGRALDPTLMRGLGRRPEGFLASGPLREVWSAVSAEQLAYETRIDGELRGVFTHALIEAVSRRAATKADANEDGLVSRQEALEHTRRRSEAACRNLVACLRSNGGALTPQLEASAALDALELGVWPASPPPIAPPIVLPLPQTRPQAGWIAGAFPQTAVSGSIRPVPDSQNPAAVLRPEGRMRLEVAPGVAGHLILARELPTGEILQMFPTRISRTPSVVFRAQDSWKVPEPNAGLAFSYDPQSSYVAVIVSPQTAAAMTLWGGRVLKAPEYLRRLQEVAAPLGISVWRPAP